MPDKTSEDGVMLSFWDLVEMAERGKIMGEKILTAFSARR